MTLAELAVTLAVLAGLGLGLGRLGVSPVPAYLLAGILLGPHEPTALSFVHPSEVTSFLAELGVVFLLFFLGLEFDLGRLARSGRHVGVGGGIDLLANAPLGFAIGVAAFGASFAAVLLAGAIYVSSSAIAVKGLSDFRRLADDETDLVLGILIFEDLAIAFVLGIAAGGGGGAAQTLGLVARALGFIVLCLAASRWLARPLERLLDRLPRELFLLATLAFVAGLAALARELGLSEAIGALMAGVVLSETRARDQIEERFFSFRDVFAALFFFAFGLSIDLGALGRVGWLLAAAVAVTLAGKLGGGYLAGLVGGFGRRQSINVGAALVAHGEFTVIIAQLAASNTQVPESAARDIAAFSGLYVLATATIGIMLLKESKRIGRRLLPAASGAERR